MDSMEFTTIDEVGEDDEETTYYGKIPLAQTIIDKVQNSPLVGLCYVLEIQKNDDVDSCNYICSLCSKKMSSATLVAHIKSVPHGLKYAEKHSAEIHEKFGKLQLKQWTAALVKEFTASLLKIEQVEGRSRMAVTKEGSVSAAISFLKKQLENPLEWKKKCIVSKTFSEKDASTKFGKLIDLTESPKGGKENISSPKPNNIKEPIANKNENSSPKPFSTLVSNRSFTPPKSKLQDSKPREELSKQGKESISQPRRPSRSSPIQQKKELLKERSPPLRGQKYPVKYASDLKDSYRSSVSDRDKNTQRKVDVPIETFRGPQQARSRSPSSRSQKFPELRRHSRSRSPRRRSKSPHRRRSRTPKRRHSRSPPGLLFRHTKRSRSPRRHSRSPLRRTKSPLRHRKSPSRRSRSPRRYHPSDKIREFRQEENRLRSQHFKDLEQYLKDPESHPRYSSEWVKFWERRFQEVERQGKDPNRHDYKSEWVDFWHIRLKEICNSDLETNRQRLLVKMRIEDPDLKPQSSTSERALYADNRRKDEKHSFENIKSFLSLKDSRSSVPSSRESLPRPVSPWEKTTSDVKPPPIAEKPKIVYEMEFSVVGTLKLLNDLEDQLGSFAPSVSTLLNKALEIAENGSKPIDLFNGKDNFVLLKLAKEKLSSQVSSGILGVMATAKTHMAIESASWLQKEAEKHFPALTTRVLDLDIGLIATATMGMGEIQVAQYIAQQLLNIGKSDCSEEDLQRILISVSAKHAKMQSDSLASSSVKSFSQPFSSTPSNAFSNSDPTQTMVSTTTPALFPSGAPAISILPTNATTPQLAQASRDSPKPPEQASKSGLSLLQSAYEDKTKDMDKRSLEELSELLSNFNTLNNQERKNLTNYLRKLEATDSKKVTKLRAMMHQNTAKPQPKVSFKPKDKDMKPKMSINSSAGNLQNSFSQGNIPPSNLASFPDLSLNKSSDHFDGQCAPHEHYLPSNMQQSRNDDNRDGFRENHNVSRDQKPPNEIESFPRPQITLNTDQYPKAHRYGQKFHADQRQEGFEPNNSHNWTSGIIKSDNNQNREGRGDCFHSDGWNDQSYNSRDSYANTRNDANNSLSSSVGFQDGRSGPQHQFRGRENLGPRGFSGMVNQEFTRNEPRTQFSDELERSQQRGFSGRPSLPLDPINMYSTVRQEKVSERSSLPPPDKCEQDQQNEVWRHQPPPSGRGQNRFSNIPGEGWTSTNNSFRNDNNRQMGSDIGNKVESDYPSSSYNYENEGKRQDYNFMPDDSGQSSWNDSKMDNFGNNSFGSQIVEKKNKPFYQEPKTTPNQDFGQGTTYDSYQKESVNEQEIGNLIAAGRNYYNDPGKFSSEEKQTRGGWFAGKSSFEQSQFQQNEPSLQYGMQNHQNEIQNSSSLYGGRSDTQDISSSNDQSMYSQYGMTQQDFSSGYNTQPYTQGNSLNRNPWTRY